MVRFSGNLFQTLVSDHTVVRPLSKLLCDLWLDHSAIVVLIFVRPIIRLQCDFALWSDRFAIILQTIVRLKCFSDDVIRVAPRRRCVTQLVWPEMSRVAHLNLGYRESQNDSRCSERISKWLLKCHVILLKTKRVLFKMTKVHLNHFPAKCIGTSGIFTSLFAVFHQ